MSEVKVSSWQWMAAGIIGAGSVVLGAFGAHGLRKVISDPNRLKTWEMAAHYQMMHTIPLLIAASQGYTWAWSITALGTGLFSGSLYLLCLKPSWKRLLGPTTPIGGTLLIAGWMALALKR